MKAAREVMVCISYLAVVGGCLGEIGVTAAGVRPTWIDAYIWSGCILVWMLNAVSYRNLAERRRAELERTKLALEAERIWANRTSLRSLST